MALSRTRRSLLTILLSIPLTSSCMGSDGLRSGPMFATLDTGVTIAYRQEGPVDGLPVVFLHGFTNDADTWSPVIDALRERDQSLRMITPDLRGHGSSTRPHDPDQIGIELMSDDVLGFLDVLGVTSATVVGHSMGSLVAQDLALNHPERVDSLVLISSTSDATKTTILADWLRKDVLANWRAQLQSRGFSDDHMMGLTPRDVDPDIGAWMQQFWNVYPITPGRSTHEVAEKSADLTLATWIGGADAVIGFQRDLTQIQVPTLVLWGVQDAFFTVSDQDRLIGDLRQAAKTGTVFRWKQFGRKPLPPDGLQADDFGHNLTWEIPDTVAEEIVSWLRTGEPTPREWFVAPDGTFTAQPNGACIYAGGSFAEGLPTTCPPSVEP